MTGTTRPTDNRARRGVDNILRQHGQSGAAAPKGVFMGTVLNLTQHPATSDQLAAGVVDPGPEWSSTIAALLTFAALPGAAELRERAAALAGLAADIAPGDAAGERAVMIGGAPYLMAPLETALRERGMTPVYAFSVRESTESTSPDGRVTKVNVFRHAGFVRPD